MRTIKTAVYKFSELSDKAKEKALQDNFNTDEYFWGKDAIKSLRKFVGYFNGELSDWNIDFLEPYRNSWRLDLPDDMEEDDIKDLLFSLGSFNPDTLKGKGDCKLTGYCADEDLIDGFRIAWFNGERDLRELIEAGISTWEIAVKKDCEYQFSEECFAETAEANDYEFTEDGKLI